MYNLKNIYINCNTNNFKYFNLKYLILQQVVLPRRYRTVDPSIHTNTSTTEYILLTKKCIESYLASWNVIHYKYSAYSGSYIQLPSE